jgi:hypothetical protein
MHNTRIVEAKVNFVRGEELLKKYADGDTVSGNTIDRYFCQNCVSLAVSLHLNFGHLPPTSSTSADNSPRAHPCFCDVQM